MDMEKMRAHFESPEGKASIKQYFDKITEKRVLDETRFDRFDKWLEINDFDKLMYRLILEHDDDYMDNCYHNGYMPHPNRKLSFIIDYVGHRVAPIIVSELACDFSNEIHFFRGYYFQDIWGQGVLTRIYNKDDNKLLLQV